MTTESVSQESTTPQAVQASQSAPAQGAAQASAAPKTVAEKLAEVRGLKPKEPQVQASTNDPKPNASVPQTSDPGEQKVGKDEQKPFRRDRDNNRFGELTKRLKEREAQIAELEKRLKSVQPPKARNEYASDEEYIDARATNAAEKKLLGEQYSAAQYRKQAEEKQAWDERVQTTVKDAKAFEQRMRSHVTDIDPETEEYVMASPHGPRMLEIMLERFEMPGAKEEFLSMPRQKRAALLVNLEMVAAATAEAPKQAPAPMPSLSPERGDKAPVNQSPSDAVQSKLNSIRNRGLR